MTLRDHAGKRALVLAQEPDGPAARIEERLVQRGFEVVTHVVVPGDEPNVAAPFPTDIDDYDLLVPMGSVRSLTNKAEIESWIDIELGLLAEAHRSDQPILGICFGLQLIAEALGGTVTKAPVTEIGWYTIDDGPDGPNPLGAGPWFEWHHDRITPPPGAQVLARNENAVQIIRMGRTVGTQFHPEVDVDHLEMWLVGTPGDYLADYDVDTDALVTETVEREAANVAQCHALVDWFLDEIAFPQQV